VKIKSGLFYLLIITYFSGILYGQEIGFVGNSITQGGYGDSVKVLMPDYTIYNFGVGGVTVEGYKSTGRYQDVLNHHPGIIVILLGTNDWRYYANRDDVWRENWKNEYQSLINTFNVWSDVYVGTIPYQTWSDEPNPTIDQMNNQIITLYNKKGLINFNSALGKNPDYFKDDGVHPNGLGNTKMAIEVWVTLSSNNSGTAPEIPKNLKAVPDDGQVTLSWDTNTEPDLSVYYLFRGTIEGGQTTGLKTFAKYYTSYIDTNVVNDTTYYYQIGAGDTLGHRSKKSDPVKATPNENIDNIPPSTPTIISTSILPNKIIIDWNDVEDDDLDHYNIYRSTTGNFTPNDTNRISIVDKTLHEYSDSNTMEPNTSYYYRISAVDTANNESGYSNEASITSLSIMDNFSISDFKLSQNYPNPFNPTTRIDYTLPYDSQVEISINDLLGKKVTTIFKGYELKGNHSTVWEGKDNLGNPVENGIYFYTIKAGDILRTRKMILLK